MKKVLLLVALATKLSTMSGKNPFSKILVYPNIDIGVNLLFNNNDYWWNEDLTSDEKHAIIHNNSKNLREFESAFKMCISRYLDAIGFKDIKFTISVLRSTISIDFF